MLSFKTAKQKLSGLPKWKLAGYGALILFVLIYVGWSFFHKPPVSREAFTAARVAPEVKHAPKVDLPVQKVRAYRKEAAVKALNLPAEIARDEKQQVIDAVTVPESRNGTTVVETIDADTGEVTAIVRENEAPWFAFQDGNYLGARYELGTAGSGVAVYYRRDIFRVKDIYAVTEVGGRVPLGVGRGEAHVSVGGEWRF